eukprot:scaffold23820_cov54-Phaeocystis_antarctica.AAC.3
MARPHAASVLSWKWSREACASVCDCRSRGEYRRAVHNMRAPRAVAEARRGDARARHTVARRADARARHTVAEARRGGARARHAVARRADARARRTVAEARRGDARARYAVVEARHAVRPSCARPSPQTAAGAGKPASRSASRAGAHPAATARRRGRGHRRC